MHQHHHDTRRPATDVTIRVSGMHCTNCALSLEKHLLRIGAHAPSVDFASGRTSFHLHDSEKLAEVVTSIRNLGYSVDDVSKPRQASFEQLLYIKTAISAVLTLPLLIAMLIPHSPLHDPLLQLYLATPVFIIGAFHFGGSAIRSLRAGIANMDVLIALGIFAGYIASVVSLTKGLSHDLIFFEATASIVTFVLIGNLLEERAVRKTSSAIESLSALQPAQAVRVVRSDNGASTTEVIPVGSVQVGDLLQVNTGDKVPTDGAIEHGYLSCDESMISGESVPVDRRSGERVIGGSIVVAGSGVVRATAVGGDTTLASIVRLVQEAQQRKPSIQKVGDAVSAVFVPGVIAISVLVLGGGILLFGLPLSQAIVRALAIAVVACPCAMGLATPTAIMVALGRAATSGFLIRGGDTLERLAAITHVAFDKTGTLTKGELKLQQLSTYNDLSSDEAKSILVALQRSSSHPIAKAVVKAYKDFEGRFTLTSTTESKGIGIEGVGLDGSTYLCGGRLIAERLGITTEDDLIVAKDNKLIASLSLSDEVRPEAAEAIRKLVSMGLSVSLISGDTARKSNEVAEALGIKLVEAEKLPEQKLEIVRTLQAKSPVAYVGDGINDAPTLAEASVGVSLSSASDVAMHSAQLLLTDNTLSHLPAAISLARLTVRTIKQNLFWAFFYNIITIPMAAFGHIAPVAGALLMTGSDVMIVGNSLRIKFKKIQ
jgi:Cu+-exporting ATPase